MSEADKEKDSAESIVGKIEESLEERKTKTDRREDENAAIPESIERRTGSDRREDI